jgi:sialidase-1
MSETLTRRQMLGTAAGATVVAFARSRRAAAERSPVTELKVISRRPQLYHGWPTVARLRSGELLLSYSGGREGHVCPFGRVELMRSPDEGRTWSDPQVLLDTLIDDRDSGVLETRKGTLLVTTFTSLAYEQMLAKAEKLKPGERGAWDPTRLARWLATRDRLSADQRKAKLGVWMLRSTDKGKTWSTPYDSLVNSPHGPIQLADGRLLYAGKDLWRPDARVGVCQSLDDGQTWQWLAPIPVRPGDVSKNYHELHAVEATDGRLVVQIRNHNKVNAGETLQCESTDGGRTWSTPHSIGVWGLPSHLLRLRDGRLVMTYGYRRKPFGNQARLSTDGGRTWSAPITLSDDGMGGDLGYPSTVELADGTLLSVWYELMKDVRGAVLRQARWKA